MGALELAFNASLGTPLVSADGSSDPSADAAVLGGSWGAHDAPALVELRAEDRGGSHEFGAEGGGVGIGEGDVVVARLDRAGSRPTVTSRADLDLLMEGLAVLGDDYTGAWLDRRTLEITIVDSGADGSAAPWSGRSRGRCASMGRYAN